MQTPTMIPTTVLKQCRHGNMLFLSSDQYIGRSLDLYGEFSELEGALFEQLLMPGDVVVEAGANIGAHTVHLSKLVGMYGKLYAFEPQRIIFQMLCANIALNNLPNVYVHQVGLGHTPGSLHVPSLNYGGNGNFGGISLTEKCIGEKVQVHTLDELGLTSLKLFKIDVEGMERDVLEGAKQTISRQRPFIYVENDRKDKSAALIQYLDSLGYEMYWHMPPLYNPENYAGNHKNVFPGIVSINLLCLPQELSYSMHGFRKVSGHTDWW